MAHREKARPAGTRREAQVFLVHLARALHTYGMPAHRLESSLAALARRLGVEGQFLVTPTSVLASFGALESQKVHMIRTEPGEIDLSKLSALADLIGRVTSGRTAPARAEAEVRDIVAARPPYPRAVTAASYAVCSGSSALFFEGGTPEILAGAAIGLAIGLLSLGAERFERLSRLVPAVAALLASFAAAAAAARVPGLYPFIPTLAGLIVLLPGLTLTVAMNELANRHLVSGSARLIGALALFFQIGMGVVVGTRLGEGLYGVAPDVVPAALPGWTLIPALALTAAGVTVLFRARARDFAVILPAAALTFFVSRELGAALGPELGIACGALALGTSANLWARLRRRPSAIAIIPAMLLIVPGSLGYRSLEALLQEDVLGGVETAFKTVLLAVALVTGLFLSNLIVPPRRGDL